MYLVLLLCTTYITGNLQIFLIPIKIVFMIFYGNLMACSTKRTLLFSVAYIKLLS